MTGVRYARGTQLRLELIDWDEVDLSVQARVLEVVTVAAPLADEIALEEADALNEEEQAAEQVDDLSGDVTDQAVAESMIDSSAELHAGAAAQGLTLPAEGPAIDTSASDRA